MCLEAETGIAIRSVEPYGAVVEGCDEGSANPDEESA